MAFERYWVALQPGGPAKDVIVIGFGASQMEDMLKTVLTEKGRVISPDAHPENGYFYRSDHISLSKKGVPMLYADRGEDLVTGGREAGEAFGKDYTDNRYHSPADEFSDSWNMDGITEDVNVDYEVINRFANNGEWPNWYDGNEFKALRDAQRAAK